MILSYYQAIRFIGKKRDFSVSLDLGLSESEIKVEEKQFILPNQHTITIDQIKKIIKKNNVCFSIEETGIYPLSIFSEKTNRYYKLVPTGYDTPPTIEISGIRMHVTKDMSPYEDTKKKISFVQPCIGKVLDTCTGLGYTAIEASKSAGEVHTFEIDENVIEIQKVNPWSKEVFSNKNIKRHHGDIFHEIIKLKSRYFDRIIHDPPRLGLATQLYSQDFYNELFRVLRRKGKLYHYTGTPGKKNRGIDLQKNVIIRLKKAGFSGVDRVYNGVVGKKK